MLYECCVLSMASLSGKPPPQHESSWEELGRKQVKRRDEIQLSQLLQDLLETEVGHSS